MSQATRCTACGTVFRVVPDQLRVSEGWVRCGRCAEVFNAIENLVDPPLTATGSAGMATGATAGPSVARVRMGSSASIGTAHPPRDGQVDMPLDDDTSAAPEWARSDLAPDPVTDSAHVGDGQDDILLRRFVGAQADGDNDGNSDSDSDTDTDTDKASPIGADPGDRDGASRQLPAGFGASDPPADAGATVRWAADDTTRDPGQVPGERSGAEPGPVPDWATGQRLPSFVRQADRAARWQQPSVRRGLAALVVLAGLGLVAQAAHSYRDLVAARWPATQPVLTRACTVLGCTVQAPRLIDALVVDSSGLLRVERSSVYKLSVTLRNRDALAVTLPALDLTLTDTQGRLVARRALRLEELGQTQTSLAAGAELVLQATLLTPDADAGAVVAGYTIDLFYP